MSRDHIVRCDWSTAPCDSPAPVRAPSLIFTVSLHILFQNFEEATHFESQIQVVKENENVVKSFVVTISKKKSSKFWDLYPS